MARIIWTESTLSDFDDIAEYIALDKVEAACRLVKHVYKNVGELEHFPELGRKPPELENSTYREIILNSCRIFYRLDQNENIYILVGANTALYFFKSSKKSANGNGLLK
ncbi:type II toxin-antitoxin system RelE/ParE family toxin [Methylicorpusculum sp.]|uniref:type II toxin-antitoxin system RelE/ParE family toxin n=1 Tax=Methylicorpusculum sp. TaxID=2713644 RepID=UPI0027164FD1|nr:type II toxin-antitoxin system RelE/ParE family toxin [Methylicorpusculum sp.]MDO8843587.1 type II toxin-antitoxin system RelE/ParE family toxin [Methylicorpusculum sp.]MDO9240599.1 type II toxin-antitoxin system RelE/ParE family toxin [Methylicorpusculum sp.]MDP2178132.1 type II toxin-antitoxin system RelE/ParE family toxin [Methylicorpusculum sp.]